jgi:predicted RNA binding protein YcfA (HicA-like mRNA interferase family)
MEKTSKLIARLRRAGFVLSRHGKKHDIYEQPRTGKRVTVWRHNRDIPTGTYLKILRDAGLGDEE